MQNWTSKEWDVFYAIYEMIPRGGPGDDVSTAKAYELLKDLPDKPRIMDVGCGPGTQTLALARISKGEIWAIDNHQGFLDSLKRRASKDGLDHFIKTVNGDMRKLDVPENYFDIIWAEGSIYFYGYTFCICEYDAG